MTKKALMVWGGWEGHEPEAVCQTYLRRCSKKEGFKVDISDTLDAYLNAEKMKSYDLISQVVHDEQHNQRAA